MKEKEVYWYVHNLAHLILNLYMALNDLHTDECMPGVKLLTLDPQSEGFD